MDNKFAIELIVDYPETIEERIRQVLNYIRKENNIRGIEISEIEATGVLGSKLSDKYEFAQSKH